jgi:hypothetical protein
VSTPNFDRYLPDPADVMPSTDDEVRALELAVDDALDAIDWPDGMDWRHRIKIDADGRIDAVIVRLLARHEHVPSRAWAEAEEAVDLTTLGLTFRTSGGLGGPFHEGGYTFQGGTFQRWEVV